MSATTSTAKGVVFRVLDAMNAPHSGRILRLRLQSGEPPAVKSLKGREMLAVAPDDRRCRIRITGFAKFGGKPSDDRLARSGRIDVQVEELDDTGPVDLRWEVRPA
ncbi:MAG: hypothetical protein U5R14_14040 [Gemmatimonadota bacterium]|nr:hypothetical protein [Gemmatimonadota bacterium]